MSIALHDGDTPEDDAKAINGNKRAFSTHPARTVWLTGLSGAGKSTLANETARSLTAQGVACCVLDGDELRKGLNSNLGFTAEDRKENIRRTAEVAAILNAAKVTVLASLISPLRVDRGMACSIIGRERFIEVHVSTPLQVCERRDPKGLYQKSRKGLLPGFTGISAPYEIPLSPDLVIDTSTRDVMASVYEIEHLFRSRNSD